MEENILDELKKLSKKATDRRKEAPVKEPSKPDQKTYEKDLKPLVIPEPESKSIPVKKIKEKKKVQKLPEPKKTNPVKPKKKLKPLRIPESREAKPIKPKTDILEIPEPKSVKPVSAKKDPKKKKHFSFFKKEKKPELEIPEPKKEATPKTTELEIPDPKPVKKDDKSIRIVEKTGSDVIIEEKVDMDGKEIIFVETNIDKLYKHIKEKGKVRVTEAAKMFDVKAEKIEEWGKILEDHDLIELHYPAIGKPILKIREVKRKNHKKRNKK